MTAAPRILLSTAVMAAAAGWPAAAEPPPARPKLPPAVRQVLKARPPEMPVEVMTAAAPGQTGAVAGKVGELGGKVQSRADEVGYLRAVVPVEAVGPLADFAGVEALDLCDLGREVTGAWQADAAYYGPLSAKDPPAGGRKPRLEVAPLGKDTPAANPYLPTREVRAPQFIADHPTYDGRGVTVAVVEAVPNLLAPELNRPALTLDGKPTRKLAAIRTGPPEEAGRPYLTLTPTRMDRVVTAKDGRFEVGKDAYRAPREAGEFRFGRFDATGERMMMKLYRAAPLPGEGNEYAVLWDEKTGQVWVDTDQDRDFADEKPLRDYNAHAEVGVWVPGRPADEQLGFAVTTDPERAAVQVHLGYAAHTTSVASVIAGAGFFGGKVGGVAPAARIALYPTLNDPWRLIEAVIRAAQAPDVDVICYAFPMTGYGWAVYDRLLDRVIDKYRKPVVNGAGNSGSGIGTTTGGASRGLISVGGFVHRDTWAALFGGTVAPADSLHFLASRGPTPDGLPKPDVVAPLVTMAATSPLDGGPLTVRAVPGSPALPRGYAVVTGTSFASPMAAGSAALLVSAAKQQGVAYDAERVRAALVASARLLDGYGPHEQGAGLIDVPRAWEALKVAPDPVRIASRGSVRAAQPPWVDALTDGPGLYEREGWSAGAKGTRTLVLNRASGPAGDATYHLSWVGNDGTFTAPATVTLPLGRDVSLPVGVAPRAAGAHSAILRLAARDGGPPVHQVGLTVVAAHDIPAGPGKSLALTGEAEWLRSAAVYFRVPEGAKSLTVEVALDQGAGVLFALRQPDRSPPPGVPSADGPKLRVVVNDPKPGVWELVADNGRSNQYTNLHERPQVPAKYRLVVSAGR